MTSTHITLGPVVYSELLGQDTPSWITTPNGLTFDWFEEDGNYVGRTGQPIAYLYIEGEVLTPESYYEVFNE